MPLYFAYGSNIDVKAMARRCPRSKALGLARLERHRLAVMREGWLTAARNPRSAVHGVLWDLALADVAALDRYEGLPQGLYAKLTQPAVTNHGPRQAIVYLGANAGPGAARPDYIANILAAANSWPLPAEGIEALERIAAMGGCAESDALLIGRRVRFLPCKGGP
jgi:AIG2-like family